MGSEDRAQKKVEDLERRFRAHPQDQNLLVALVDAYHAAGRYGPAADALEPKLVEDPGSDWTLLEKYCELCRQGGRSDRAYEFLGNLAQPLSDQARYWILRGRMLEEMGRLDEARTEHGRALQIAPLDPEAHFRFGVTLMKAHQDEEAIASFERCLELDPAMTKAQINIGVILDQSGESERAIEAFRKAIEANPQSAESHCNLGAAYGDLGRRKDAIAEFHRAIAIDPADAEAHFNLGLVLMEDAPEEAMAELKRAQGLDPGNWDINYNLGLIYFRKGMYDAAVRLLHQCVQARPDAANALYYLGVSYNKKDQPGLAIECLDRVLELDPSNARAQFYLGVAYDKKGLSEKARLCYQAADRLGGNA